MSTLLLKVSLIGVGTVLRLERDNIWKQRNEHPTVGGVSNTSRNGAPSRKGCVANG